MDKLHIVHTESSMGWGGQEIRILTEAEGLAARGHRITLVTPPGANIYREGKARGLEVVPLAIGRKKISGVTALLPWLRNNLPDVINTHSSTDAWLAAVACRFLDRPPAIVRTRHISTPVLDNFATRWLYSTATRHIVTTGERLRNELIDRNGFDPSRITSVPTGIDTSKFVPGDKYRARRQLGLPEDRPTLGIIATLRDWKGHTYLLDAFAGLASHQVGLLIVGDGPQREALKRRIDGLGLGARVQMPGNQADVVPWFQALDVFVLPSYANEGVPQAVLQAMSCGIPVVSTSVGSIPEAVRNEDTGLIVAPRDAEVLREAIERLLANAELRLRFGDAARKAALQKFGLAVMLDKMETVFSGAIRA